jgi:hypothetical protein
VKLHLKLINHALRKDSLPNSKLLRIFDYVEIAGKSTKSEQITILHYEDQIFTYNSQNNGMKTHKKIQRDLDEVFMLSNEGMIHYK